jgi:hypothetical protein
VFVKVNLPFGAVNPYSARLCGGQSTGKIKDLLSNQLNPDKG